MQHIEMLEGNVIKREENNLPTSYAKTLNTPGYCEHNLFSELVIHQLVL